MHVRICMYIILSIHVQSLYIFVKFSLAEKVNGLTKALKGAEEKHKTVYQELDRVSAELAHTETECVFCGLKSMKLTCLWFIM